MKQLTQLVPFFMKKDEIKYISFYLSLSKVFSMLLATLNKRSFFITPHKESSTEEVLL